MDNTKNINYVRLVEILTNNIEHTKKITYLKINYQ